MSQEFACGLPHILVEVVVTIKSAVGSVMASSCMTLGLTPCCYGFWATHATHTHTHVTWPTTCQTHMRMKTCIAIIKVTLAIASLACCMYQPRNWLIGLCWQLEVLWSSCRLTLLCGLCPTQEGLLETTVSIFVDQPFPLPLSWRLYNT